MRYPWKNQEKQHPKKGKPGITYRKIRQKMRFALPEVEIDALLFYSKTGILCGILYYYGSGCYPEDPGNINLYVRPSNQRNGIATKLLLKAQTLWNIDFTQQTYTNSGLALCRKLGLI